MASVSKDSKPTILLQNRRAYHDYTVEDTLEAGLVLQGSEVKAIRAGLAQLTDAYIATHEGELFLHHMNISAYRWASTFNHLPQRRRKLLAHKKQIERLAQATSQRGYTLLPLEVYSSTGRIKVLVGVCKGKKQYDKRREQREKDVERELRQAGSR